jgi:hypothetical protein
MSSLGQAEAPSVHEMPNAQLACNTIALTKLLQPKIHCPNSALAPTPPPPSSREQGGNNGTKAPSLPNPSPRCYLPPTKQSTGEPV